MNKIRKLSSVFKWIFLIAFIVLPMLTIWVWVNSPSPSLLWQAQLFSFVQGSLSLLVNQFIVYSLIRLFMLYQRLEIFSLQNILYIKRIAYAVMVGQLLQFIYQPLLSLIITWHNPPGLRYTSISINQTNVGMLLAAVLLILIAWIMAEGHQLHEEQKYIV